MDEAKTALFRVSDICFSVLASSQLEIKKSVDMPAASIHNESMNVSWPAGMKEYFDEKFKGVDARLALIKERIDKSEIVQTKILGRLDENDIKQDEILTAIEHRFQDHDRDLQLHRMQTHDHECRILKLEKKAA